MNVGTATTTTADVVGTAASNAAMMDEVRALQALKDAQAAAAEASEAAEAAEAAEALESAEGAFQGIEAGVEMTSLISDSAAVSAAADAAVLEASAAAEAATAQALAVAAGEGAAATTAEVAAGVASEVAADALAVGLAGAGETFGTSLVVMGGIAAVAGTTALVLDNQEAIGKEVTKDANVVSQTVVSGANAISKGFNSIFN